MNIQIDNYYISTSGKYLKVCLDGQNIIHDNYKPVEFTKSEAVNYAMKAIERYNRHHDLAWGKLT